MLQFLYYLYLSTLYIRYDSSEAATTLEPTLYLVNHMINNLSKHINKKRILILKY